MKLELCSNLAETITNIAIGAIVASVILGIAFMIFDSSNKTQSAIANATTCEQAVILTGTDVSNRLIGCKIQVQQVAIPVGK